MTTVTQNPRAAVLTARQRWSSLAAIVAASFGVGLSFGVGFPLTTLTFAAWHQPDWIIGFAGSLPAIGVLLALPALPRIVAKIGPVASIFGGCLIGAVSFLALYAVPTPIAWMVIRLVMSAGLALPWLAGETWINSVALEQSRGRALASYTIAFFAGFALGPYVLQFLGLTGIWPFLAGAIAPAVAGFPIFLVRRFAPAICHNSSHSLLSVMRLAPTAMAGAFIGGFAEITNLSLIPNVALAAGLSKESALQFLTVMTVGGCVLQFLIGWFSDKVSRYAVTVLLAIGFIILVLVLPYVLTTKPLALIVAFLLGGVIMGFYTVGLALLGERVGLEDLAAANAAFLVVYQLGAIIGPLAAGVAMNASPIVGFVATMVALMVVSLAAVIALQRMPGTPEANNGPSRG